MTPLYRCPAHEHFLLRRPRAWECPTTKATIKTSVLELFGPTEFAETVGNAEQLLATARELEKGL
jgi:hypothetical protein